MLDDSHDPNGTTERVPVPTVMPLNRKEWRAQLGRTNFVNTWCQYNDVRSLGDHIRTILIIGPGQGLDTVVLRWRGYQVTTFDIDETFEPDVLGSVHDLAVFQDGQFDVVIASHVIEHVAVPYLDRAISELARVARYALIYLPVHGRKVQFRLLPGFRDFDWSFVLDLFNYFHKPDGLTARYNANQHFWEVGMRGFRTKDCLRRFAPHFETLRHYRNTDWLLSHNFVLRSRRYMPARSSPS
jgi:SAM-dependent methyltransferase